MNSLVASIGNTTTVFGHFTARNRLRQWRVATAEVGRFRLPHLAAERSVLCSVVPGRTATVANLMKRASGVRPTLLSSTSRHGLRVEYRDPSRFGADRLAAALGARARFPGRDIVVVDCGTATTVTALARDGRIRGGAILPGLALWPAMLSRRTAQLPEVRVRRPRGALGHSPEEAILAGAWWGHAGAVRAVVAQVKTEAFGRARGIAVIGTGGNASALADSALFTACFPALALEGLRAWAENRP